MSAEERLCLSGERRTRRRLSNVTRFQPGSSTENLPSFYRQTFINGMELP